MPVTIKILDYNEILAAGVPDMELHFNDQMKQYCGQQFMLTGRSHCQNAELWDSRGSSSLIFNSKVGLGRLSGSRLLREHS